MENSVSFPLATVKEPEVLAADGKPPRAAARVIVDRIDTEADDLAVAPFELGLELCHIAEFGRAYRCEVFGMREQPCPLISDPLVKPGITRARSGDVFL
jgi:hypothetical protein